MLCPAVGVYIFFRKAVRMRDQRPATEDILARVEQRREDLLRQHATSKRETRREIIRMRSDAAEDRRVIMPFRVTPSTFSGYKLLVIFSVK